MGGKQYKFKMFNTMNYNCNIHTRYQICKSWNGLVSTALELLTLSVLHVTHLEVQVYLVLYPVKCLKELFL